MRVTESEEERQTDREKRRGGRKKYIFVTEFE